MIVGSRYVVAVILCICLCGPRSHAGTPTATVQDRLATVLAVEKYGKGNEEAQRALRDLFQVDADDLLVLLGALDRSSPLASNWIRNAFEAVADRELKAKHPLPAADLEAFVRDVAHEPRARRLAYDWLLKVDPTASARLIPGMLHDPGPEFRRDAVAMRIEDASKIDPAKNKPEAIHLYREALSGAVHEDQVKSIAGSLAKLGQKVNIVEHLGFLTHFDVIGPFDNRGGKGFQAVYPPEKEIKRDATYEGQLGKVKWSPLSTTHDYGLVDIAKQVKPYKGAVMYLVTDFVSPTRRALELRIGTPNAWKIWVNGESLFAREEYHRGSMIDQYRVPVTMRAGRNVILLKMCQNEQTPDWAQAYAFQLRVCDASGSGVPSASHSQNP
jgi:hypothetical protein